MNNNTEIRAVLLDRDGVINFDSDDFIKSPAEWQPIPGAVEAIAALQKRFVLAVCTNQSGVGRGLLDAATLAAIHDRLQETLLAAGGQPIDIFFCPHLPEEGCACRKPQPGLLQAAMASLDVTPAETIFVGDSARDLEAAANAGCQEALVLTGNGATTLRGAATIGKTSSSTQTFVVYDSLADMASKLINT